MLILRVKSCLNKLFSRFGSVDRLSCLVSGNVETFVVVILSIVELPPIPELIDGC